MNRRLSYVLGVGKEFLNSKSINQKGGKITDKTDLSKIRNLFIKRLRVQKQAPKHKVFARCIPSEDLYPEYINEQIDKKVICPNFFFFD